MDALDRYTAYLQTICQRQVRTVDFHRRTIKRWRVFLDTHQGKCEEGADGEDCLVYMGWRQEVGGLMDRTLAKELCALRTYYRYLHQQRVIPRNALEVLPDLVCKPVNEALYLTVPECVAMLETIDITTPQGLRDYTLLAVLWSTGLRTNELKKLDWEAVDLQEGLLVVLHGKGAKQRQLFLNERVWDDLLRYHDVLGQPASGPVFTATGANQHVTRMGERRISDRRIVEIVREAAEAAGLTRKVSPRMMRHTFATHMYEAGVSIEEIQQMLGHDDETETTIYIHITMQAVRHLLQQHIAMR